MTDVDATRPISWVKAARKDFEDFPFLARAEFIDALTIAAEGGKAETAKPMKGMDGGVFEIAAQAPRRRLPRNLRRAIRRRALGDPRFSEEIKDGN